MTQARDPLPFEVLAPATSLCIIEALLGDEAVLRTTDPGAPQRRARLALPREQVLEPGDTVVVLRVADQDLVIASLARRRGQLQLADGSTAQLDAEGQALELRGADGGLLLRYTRAGQASRLELEADQVSIAALSGDLSLRAAGRLQLAGQAVELRGGAAGDAHATLGAAGITLTTQRSLALQADDARHEAQRLHVRSAELQGELGDVRVIAKRLESVAEHVVQRAQTFYQRVEALAQQRLGSLRVLVDQSLHVQAQRALTRTEESFKVRADQIHLG